MQIIELNMLPNIEIKNLIFNIDEEIRNNLAYDAYDYARMYDISYHLAIENYVIEDNGELHGCIGITKINSLSYWLKSTSRSKGYIQRAFRLMQKLTFPMTASCWEGNTESVATLFSLGFEWNYSEDIKYCGMVRKIHNFQKFDV